MTQENKDLLLRDLCARLPYNVIGLYSWKGHKPYNRELFGSLFDELECSWGKLGSLRDPEPDSKFFPYLRPMSSMTEEEYKEWSFLCSDGGWGITVDLIVDCVNWLLKYHFDFRGLIPKGCAIEVTEENNPYGK